MPLMKDFIMQLADPDYIPAGGRDDPDIVEYCGVPPTAGWDQFSLDFLAAAPLDDPQAHYDTLGPAHWFMGVAAMNPTHAAQLYETELNLVADLLVAAEPSDLAHPYLDDLATAGSPDYAAALAWGVANRVGGAQWWDLVHKAADYLGGGNSITAVNAASCLFRSKARITFCGDGDCADAVLIIWKDNTTLSQWCDGRIDP